jgi:hypothetical protein
MPRATPTSPRAFRPLFKFSPRQNSEVHLVDNENGLAWDEWEEARERGFVVSMYAGKGIRQIELTKRWYSMANIRVADFNGDGLVTMLDRDMALAAIDHAIANPEAIDIIVYATGDINNDNFIDEDDRLYFNDVFFNHPELIENYGEARNL